MAFLFESYSSLFFSPMANEVPLMQVHHIFFQLLVQCNLASLFVELSPIFIDSIVVKFSVLLFVEPVLSFIYVLLDEIGGFLGSILVRWQVTVWGPSRYTCFATCIVDWGPSLLLPGPYFSLVVFNFLIPFWDGLSIHTVLLNMCANFILKLVSHFCGNVCTGF